MAAGRITGCYGVRGWVKVQPYTEVASDLLAFPEWWLQARNGPTPVAIDDGRVHGRGLVLHLVGIDDRDSAERLRGQALLVRAQAMPELDEDEYYWHQLETLQVWCRDRDNPDAGEQLLGTVHHLIETGANDVLVVAPCEGSIDERERLIPYLPGSVVLEVDLKAGRLSIDWFINE